MNLHIYSPQILFDNIFISIIVQGGIIIRLFMTHANVKKVNTLGHIYCQKKTYLLFVHKALRLKDEPLFFGGGGMKIF